MLDDFNGRVVQKSNVPEDPFIKIVWGSEKSELLLISKDELDSSQWSIEQRYLPGLNPIRKNINIWKIICFTQYR